VEQKKPTKQLDIAVPNLKWYKQLARNVTPFQIQIHAWVDFHGGTSEVAMCEASNTHEGSAEVPVEQNRSRAQRRRTIPVSRREMELVERIRREEDDERG